MKNKFCSLLVLLLTGVLLTACIGKSGPEVNADSDIYITDRSGLIDALNAADAVRGVGDPIKQEFFTVEGQIIKVRESDIQVFEYENAEVMETDAVKVASDGGSIGNTMVAWMATPHFFKAGRIIVLYVGDDEEMLTTLQSLLGEQFAGR